MGFISSENIEATEALDPVLGMTEGTRNMNSSTKKVFVGMSGGVDSSVSAALLQQATPNNFEELFGRPTPEGFRGFDVTGVFIKVWSPEWLPCDWKAERRDAMRVAAHLGIPFETLDLEEEYKREVADYMIEEYRRGRTPNPDVMCNRSIKFGGFLKYALENGADFVATGHYAQIKVSSREFLVASNENSLETKNYNLETFSLHEGADKNKDQSYFLWTLGQEQLKHVLFPVGHLQKPEVRKLAEKFGLPTAAKKDSQGICFLGDVDMKDFLAHYIEQKRGDVVNERGETIGFHDGAIFLTLGERRGFTVTHTSPNDPPLYIVAKDIDKNTITVSPERAGISGDFEVSEAVLENVNWISDTPNNKEKLLARFRYRQEPIPGTLKMANENVSFEFSSPQSSVSSGQSLVLYSGEKCVGGGIITQTIH